MAVSAELRLSVFRRGLLATSAVAVLCASPAFAQNAGAAVGPSPVPPPTASDPTTAAGTADAADIVVTARGRSERLLQAPVAVTAVSGGLLTTQGIRSTTDLGAVVPALTIDATGSGAGGTIALRGISTTSSQAGFDQAVSIAVDGVQTGRAQTLHAGLFDLEQIEVLKGPQALFFGKNSPGGVISLRTANPTDKFEAYATGGYEFVGDEYKLEGAVSGPVTSDFGARLAVSYTNLDGYFRNNRKTQLTAAENPLFPLLDGGQPPLGHQRPGNKDLIGRLTLTYHPAGSGFDANLKLSADRFRSDGPNQGGQAINCGPGGVAIDEFGPFAFSDPVAECKNDFHYTSSGYLPGKVANWPYARELPYSKINTYLAALNMNYKFNDLTLASTTGYFKLNSSNFDNYDATSFNQISAAEHEGYKSFTQELRLISNFSGPLNFIVGGFYQHTNLFFFNAASIAPGPDDGSVSGPENAGKYQSWERPGSTKGNTYSGFGQLRWNILQDLELAGGVRFTRETKNSEIGNTYVNSNLAGLILPAGVVYTNRFKGHNWSPEVTLSYRPTSDLTLYGGYRTGYKSGGFGLTTVLTVFTTADDLAYKPERIKGFEVGAKGRLFDRLLTYNLSAYTYKYNDLQVSQFNGQTLSFNVTNAGSARIKGVELELSSQPMDGLTLRGSVNYNSARYISFDTLCYATQCTGEQSLAGGSLNQAPRWTGSAGFDYQIPVMGEWTLGLGGNLRTTSKYETQPSNDPAGIQHGFTTLDGSIRLTAPAKRYNLALIGRNLTNKRYFNVSNGKPGTPATLDQLEVVPERGREVWLELTFRY